MKAWCIKSRRKRLLLSEGSTKSSSRAKAFMGSCKGSIKIKCPQRKVAPEAGRLQQSAGFSRWEQAQKRRQELEGAWPMIKLKEKPGNIQKSYVYSNPTHLFAGLLQCKCCGEAIVQVCGKAGGYYGCYNAKRKTCTNKLTIQRKRIEELLLSSLKERFLTAENLRYVFDNVEKEVTKTLGQVPEELKQKRHQHEKVQAELQNLLSFGKAGNFSRVVSFKAPPKEWIEFGLEKLYETLNQNSKASALALKDLLGTIELEPVPAECIVENGRLIENRPYYLAHTNIDTLALLD